MAVQGFDRISPSIKFRGANIAPKLGDEGRWADMWLDWAARIAPGGDIYQQVTLAAGLGCNLYRIMSPTGQLLDGTLLAGNVSTPGTVIYYFKQLHDLVASVGGYLYPCLSIGDGGGIHWNSGTYDTAAVVATAVALANKLKSATDFPRVICMDGQNEGNAWVQSDTAANNVARCVMLGDALRTEVAGSGIPITVSQVYDAFGSNQSTAPNGGWTDNSLLATLTPHIDFIDLHCYRDTSTNAYPYELNLPFFRWRVDGPWSGGATGISLPILIGEGAESVYDSAGFADPLRQPRFEQLQVIAAHPNVVGVAVWCVKSAVTAPGAGGPEDLPQFTFGIFDANGDPYTGAGDVRSRYQTWPKLYRSGISIPYEVISASGFSIDSTDASNPTNRQETNAAFPTPITTAVTITMTATMQADVGTVAHARIYIDGVAVGEGVSTTANQTLTETVEATLTAGYHVIVFGTWKVGGGSAVYGGTPGSADASGLAITVPITPSSGGVGAGGLTGTGVLSGTIGPGRIRGG